MRILMIHNRYQATGGEDVSTDSQVALLRDAGHHVELVEDSNERIGDLGIVRTSGRSIWSREAHRQIASLLEAGGFDVMHVQNFFPLFSPSVYYAAAKHNVPVVQSLRNFRILCPEGMLSRDDEICTDCVGRSVAWPAIKHRCYRESRSGSAVVAAMATGHRLAGTWRRRVARYVAPSQAARRIYIDGGWDPEQIEVIHNFVYPDPGPGTGAGGYVLYAGRLAPPKGLSTLIEAWRDPRIKVPLKIAGEGPLKHLVRGAVRSNPLVEYLGVVDVAEVSRLAGEAMLAVVPTTGIETHGRAASEALAHGTPVVAAGHGGLAEIVTDGRNGALFEPGDAAGLASAVVSVLEDPVRLAGMREQARAVYLEQYSGDVNLDAWIDLYRRVAGS